MIDTHKRPRGHRRKLLRLKKHVSFRRCLFLLMVACSKSAGAQTSASPPGSNLPGSDVRASRRLFETDAAIGRKNFEAYLKFESLQYPTPVPGQENLNQNNMVEAGLLGQSRIGSARGRYDVRAGRSLNLNYSFFAVQDLAVEMPLEISGVSLTAGRSLEFWSKADDDWHLGMWQPLFSVDGLRPVTQGLTGLSLKADTSKLQAVLFYSPFFIPTTTPDLADRNGEITSESRWFRPIPNSTELIGKETTLYYRIAIPEIRELVSKQGVAGRLRIGDRKEGPWGSVAFADKPMNSLFFKYDASLRAREEGSRGEVELRPVSLRHQVIAVDAGWNYDGGALSVSLTEDRPRPTEVVNQISDGLRTDYIQQKPQPLQIASARWDQALQIPRMKSPLFARIDYMKARIGPTTDVDAEGVERSSLLPNQLLYTNALSFEGRSSLSARWDMGLKYLRDFDQQGSVWSAELNYRTRAKWLITMGADVLGADDPSEGNTDTRFLNAYRQNDRVYGGVSYVF